MADWRPRAPSPSVGAHHGNCMHCSHQLRSRSSLCPNCNRILSVPHCPNGNHHLPKVMDRRRKFKLSKLFGAFRSHNRTCSSQDGSESNGSSDTEDYIDVGHRQHRGDSLAMGKKSVSEYCLPSIGPFASVKKLPIIATKAGFAPHIYAMPAERTVEMQEIQRPQLQIRTVAELNEEVKRARKNGNYEALTTFFADIFHSLEDVTIALCLITETDMDCDHSKKCKSRVNLQLVDAVYAHLLELPYELQKATLKSVINCLLTDPRTTDTVVQKPACKDNLRAYMILLQNPQFQKPSTYVVFAHLLRQLATLRESDQRILANWFMELTPKSLQATILCIQQFISNRLFPPRPQDLPPMSKCYWWIPCAVRVLGILNTANNLGNQIVPFTEFYNNSVDHWDLMSEYGNWETPSPAAAFSFCQYPFILSINAKRQILEYSAEQQMIQTARDSIIGNLVCHREPDMNMLFLTLTVRRRNLLQDSLTELTKKQPSLRKKLRVQFAGEPGLDMGGLAKEWFQLLIKEIFDPDYGMFVYYSKSEVFWFSTHQGDTDNLQEFYLIGTLMGLAVYNGIILDLRFPDVCYKKLLSPSVIPRAVAVQTLDLGIATVTLDDLAQIMPDTAKGLKEMLEYDGNVKDDFGMNFQLNVEEFGAMRTVNLKQEAGGVSIPVTNSNRDEYVQLYVDWILNQAIMPQFKAFYLGFHSVMESNVLLLFRPEEIEMLVCGSPDFDMTELKKVTIYDGYMQDDKTIKHFWELVLKLPSKHQRRLLLFVTGSDRVPVGGMREMSFKISKMISTNPKISPENMLPMAHTCFNQLVLPDYQDRKILRQKLAIALAHGEGFGLE